MHDLICPKAGANNESIQLTEQANAECRYVSLDRKAMHKALSQQLDDDLLYRMLIEERPHLFAEAIVFVDEASISKQRDIIAAIESVIAMPAYQQRALTYAPDTAQFMSKAHGVFFGYDFHLSPKGPKGPQIIEIKPKFLTSLSLGDSFSIATPSTICSIFKFYKPLEK
ncbi:MAG: hypothetical protein Q7U18_10905 [Methylobacter sp.]|nr:hypothetical protein [Methylobacter sp.]